MTVKLAEVQDPRPAATPQSAWLKQRLARETGARDAQDVRATVASVCGGWSQRRGRDSDHERDALAQELALWLLERQRAGTVWKVRWGNSTGEENVRWQDLQTPQRRALLRAVLTRDLIRDSRAWQDSLEGRELFRVRARTAASGFESKRADVLGDTVAEQAARYRAAERARRPAPFTRLDTPTDDDDGNGATDHLEEAGRRERERNGLGDEPPVTLAEHSRELAALMLDRIEAALAKRPVAVRLDASARESLLVALCMAGGERLEPIAVGLGVSIATAKRRSTAGAGMLRDWIEPHALVRIRRECVAELAEQDSGLPNRDARDVLASLPALADASKLVGLAHGAARKQAAARAAGSESRAMPRPAGPWRTVPTARGNMARVRSTRTDVARGSARDVLGYIARVERALARPAQTFRTDDARRVEQRGWQTGTALNLPARRKPHGGSEAAWLVLSYIDALLDSSGGSGDRVTAHGWGWQRARQYGPVGTVALVGKPPRPRASTRTEPTKREREAVTLARRIAREPTRARRVTAYLKVALANRS